MQKQQLLILLPRIILYPSTSASHVIFWLDSSTLRSATGVTQVLRSHFWLSTWKKEKEHQNFRLVPTTVDLVRFPWSTHTQKGSSACYVDTRIDQLLPEEKPSSQGCNKNVHLIDCDGACNLFTVMYPRQQEEHRSDGASQEEPLHYSTPPSVLLSYFGVGITYRHRAFQAAIGQRCSQ